MWKKHKGPAKSVRTSRRSARKHEAALVTRSWSSATRPISTFPVAWISKTCAIGVETTHENFMRSLCTVNGSLFLCGHLQNFGMSLFQWYQPHLSPTTSRLLVPNLNQKVTVPHSVLAVYNYSHLPRTSNSGDNHLHRCLKNSSFLKISLETRLGIIITFKFSKLRIFEYLSSRI